MTRYALLGISFLALVAVAVPSHATNVCSYNFGNSSSPVTFCVTANGNILALLMDGQYWVPSGGGLGEGYGICNESAAQNYTDYGFSDTGNWNPAVLVSHMTNSVKIARTTADGNWTLTQTITFIPSLEAVNIVMALTNNQTTTHTVYLTRWADVENFSPPDYFYLGAFNSATVRRGFSGTDGYGLQLENVGKPPFGFSHGYVLYGKNIPNACAFAYFEGSYGSFANFIWEWGETQWGGSIEMAYVGPVGAGQTKTVTLRYHPL